MNIQASEISEILKEQIKKFGKESEVAEVGTVLSVGDGIARVFGLDNVQAGEMVEFPGGIRGMALNLEIDNVGIVMKYPSLDVFIQQNLAEDPDIEDVFELAAGCIDQVYDSEEVYDTFTKKEALDFLEELNADQFGKIQQFFETMPKLSYTLEVTNPNTKVKSEMVLEGLAAFFE